MLGRIQKICSRVLLLTGLVLFLLISQFALMPKPAMAILRQHHDAPGVLRYHSQESLRDESGNAWQVVLFKQITPGQPTCLNLRLVGFPGIVEFTHPQPLEVTTAAGQILTATDVFAGQSPAANVGQYNLTQVLNKLPTSDSLKLSVPLKDEKRLSLQIPQQLVTEWQLLVTEIQ